MLTMYDSVDLSAVPSNAAAVAGYVNGKWPTFPSLAKKFPKALHLSISVNAEGDAECLDVEPLDATNAQAPAWVRRQKAHGIARPVVYTSLSNAHELLGVLAASDISRDQIRLWTAHYTHTAHLCGPYCGFGLATHADATQYTDIAMARNLDASAVSAGFFAAPVSRAVRRRRLRVWVLARIARGATWGALKKTAQWKLWRRLGGK